MNDKALVRDAIRAFEKVPVDVVRYRNHNGHWRFLLRYPDGEEKEFTMSGSPTVRESALHEVVRVVKRYKRGYYA